MRVVLIHGPPAVGKLTVAERLSRIIDAPVLHYHVALDAASVLFPFGSGPWLKLARTLLMDFVEAALNDGMGHLVMTFIYGRFPNDEDFIARLESALRESGAELLVVRLTCKRGELEKRVVSPSRHEHGKLTTVKDLRKVLENFDMCGSIPNTREFTLDTSEVSAEEVAKRVLERFDLKSR